MSDFVAEQEILWRRSDGSSKVITAKISAPSSRTDGGWSCNVRIDGIDDRNSEVAGGSSIQAVKLALDELSSRMRHLIYSGEMFYFVDDPEGLWDEEAIRLAFGGAFGSNFSSKPTT
jgi:hypothetical protein